MRAAGGAGRRRSGAVCDDGPMTRIIAHRGASRAEPENTLAAFRRAGEMGADGVELDVRRTADDRLVVHHDATLPDGRVIRTVAAADLPDSVPTLAAALDACADMFVNVEIKNSPDDPDFDPTEWVAHRVIAELATRTPHSRWLISSFRLETVDVCRRHGVWFDQNELIPVHRDIARRLGLSIDRTRKTSEDLNLDATSGEIDLIIGVVVGVVVLLIKLFD